LPGGIITVREEGELGRGTKRRKTTMTERNEEETTREARAGRRRGLPQPDWDSGDVFFNPLPSPADPFVWRTLQHNLNSMDLLVDWKLGGTNAQGRVEWVLPSQTLLRLPDPNTVIIRWAITQDEWNRYFGLTQPRVRVWIWRW
jgi:hypothetical protein